MVGALQGPTLENQLLKGNNCVPSWVGHSEEQHHGLSPLRPSFYGQRVLFCIFTLNQQRSLNSVLRALVIHHAAVCGLPVCVMVVDVGHLSLFCLLRSCLLGLSLRL